MLSLNPFRWVRRILSLLVLVAAGYFIVTAVQVITASRAPSAVGVGRNEPAIVVVASSTDLKSRLNHASALRSAHRAPRIVIVATTSREVSTARRYLATHGVPPASVSAVVATDVPTGLADVARTRHLRRALVVADTWQTLWLTHVASAVGIRVVASPVSPHESFATTAGTVAGQAATVAWGRIVGFGP